MRATLPFFQSCVFCKWLWCKEETCYLQFYALNTLQWNLSNWKQGWLTSTAWSVQIRSYFWSVFSCIRTEYGEVQSQYIKIRTSNNSVFEHFSHSVILRKFLWICIITFVMTVLWSYVITVSFAYYFFPFYYFWNTLYLK